MKRPHKKKSKPQPADTKNSSSKRNSPRNKNQCDTTDSPLPTTKRQKLYNKDDNNNKPNTDKVINAIIDTEKGKVNSKQKNLDFNSKDDLKNPDAGDDWNSSTDNDGDDNDNDEDNVDDDDVDDEGTTLTDEMTSWKMTKKDFLNRNKVKSLTEAEVSNLSNFVRRTVFRRMKFINDGLMVKLLPEIHQRLGIEDAEDKTKKTDDIMRFTKETLSSRRGYSTMVLCNKLRGTLMCFKSVNLSPPLTKSN